MQDLNKELSGMVRTQKKTLIFISFARTPVMTTKPKATLIFVLTFHEIHSRRPKSDSLFIAELDLTLLYGYN